MQEQVPIFYVWFLSWLHFYVSLQFPALHTQAPHCTLECTVLTHSFIHPLTHSLYSQGTADFQLFYKFFFSFALFLLTSQCATLRHFKVYKCFQCFPCLYQCFLVPMFTNVPMFPMFPMFVPMFPCSNVYLCANVCTNVSLCPVEQCDSVQWWR